MVGFDGIEAASWTQPPLTTVEQPIADIAETAVDALKSLIDEPGPGLCQTTSSGLKLRVRASTAPPKESSMSKIVIDHVTKIYPGDVKAVDDVSLEIASGEFMVLVGPSGCGKSTLLRMIAGLEDVTEGTILHRRPRRDRALAARSRHRDGLPELRALPAHDRAQEPRLRAARFARRRSAEIERRVDEVAKLLGLEELLDRRPAALSGGQRQRVAMGRAIVREPAGVPDGRAALEPRREAARGMRAELARLHDRLGVTTVYVTHDQVEAMTLGQRVAVMRDGRIQQVDAPQKLYQRAGEPLRRRVHRLAVDEPRRGDR